MKTGKSKFLIINLITIVVILALAEIISRIILNKTYNRDFDSALIVEHKYFNSPGLKENAYGIVWGKTFNTDQFGGRKNKSNQKQRRTRLYIGDSVTEGVGVDDSSTFCYKVSEKNEAFNCLNISMIGYSSADYLNVLRQRIAIDSSISNVVLCFCLNDVYGSSKTKDLPVMRKQNMAGRLNSILQEHYATYKLLKLLVYQNANRYFQYDLQFYKEEDPHFVESMNDLHQCDSMCRANNISFQVVIFPYRSQLVGKNFNNRVPQNAVQDFCGAHHIHFADVTNHLAGYKDPAALYLFADEIHFSAEGHLAIAEFMNSINP